jgi:Ca2+-binding EF-hand superfamily protein
MADFTAEQKERLKNLFNHIDTDHDGKIKAADLKAFASAELGRDITDERAKVNCKRCDVCVCASFYVTIRNVNH